MLLVFIESKKNNWYPINWKCSTLACKSNPRLWDFVSWSERLNFDMIEYYYYAISCWQQADFIGMTLLIIRPATSQKKNKKPTQPLPLGQWHRIDHRSRRNEWNACRSAVPLWPCGSAQTTFEILKFILLCSLYRVYVCWAVYWYLISDVE